jgi:hypothetical protein
MQQSPDPNQQREFRCEHCKGLIRIPAHLPSTTGPCPHCGNSITSPAADELLTDTVKPFANTDAEDHSIPGKGPKIRYGDEDEDADETESTKRSYLAAWIGLFFIILAVGLGCILAMRELQKEPVVQKDKAVEESEAVREAHYIRIGWKKDAFKVLDDFMKGTTGREKIPHVLEGAALAEKIEAFYGDQVINDSDTPAEAFSVFNLSEEDRKRGLFMLVFDQPPQFSMKDFFRPLASLEVQYGLAEADLLLTSMARVSNFAIEPVRVHAFFKKTPAGLKLDWEIFTQTKYSMLQHFIEDPQIGKKKTFRVFVMEDVHDPRFSIVTSRTYRIADPANTDHSARLVVPVDSDVGKQLSVINWVGSENKKPETRTATVELEWRGNENQPQLAISRFLCWEFIGLGGDMDTSHPVNSTRENP